MKFKVSNAWYKYEDMYDITILAFVKNRREYGVIIFNFGFSITI